MILNTDAVVDNTGSNQAITKLVWFIATLGFMIWSMAKLMNQPVFITGAIVESEVKLFLKIKNCKSQINQDPFFQINLEN